jgi:uncharacterized membrane protein HdeD (DUF308 family)/acetyl esterase/lipase
MGAVNRLVARLPAWVVVLVALACVAGGVVLIFRPFTSIDVLVLVAGIVSIVTGVLTLLSPEERAPAYRWLVGAGWIVLGVAVLAWPNVSVRALAVVIGVALVVNGVVNIVEALTGRTEEPVTEFIGGLASIVFGVLALVWPDVTVFVVAVLFGARTVLFGLSQLLSLVKRWRQPAAEAAAAPEPERPSGFRRALRLGTRVVGLLVALLLLAVSVLVHEDEVPAFYEEPASVPSTPGELLDSESFDAGPDDVDGWRILYSTTDTNDESTVGSAFVIAAQDRPQGPRPVILWTHGTVGVERPCAPSLYNDVVASAPAGATPIALDDGSVMVAPDYPGMGTEATGVAPYLIGRGQAYSSLDALRAAYQLEDLSLDREQTVVWGHSQGGNAALWTGVLAADYARELTIDGVAALAPASDLVPLAQSVQGAAAGTVVTAFFLTAYANAYDDVNVDEYVRPGATVAVREAAERCLTSPRLAASLITASGGESLFRRDLSTGPLGDRLRENTPTADMEPPLLVASGTGDEVINISINEGWVAQQCEAGYELDFRTYPDRTHMGVLEADSPLTEELTAWTADRFAGRPAESTC